MTSNHHPNFETTQAALDAARAGDYSLAFDSFTDDIVVENGPGAGPWHRATNKDDFARLRQHRYLRQPPPSRRVV
jgi:ketosteroid isomerase-like protein